MARQGAESTQDLYTIGEVAAILGVSPHTIRAWERRHGVVKPLRTGARQRRYRAEDVDVLREVKKAVDVGGMTLKLASRAVREGRHVPAPRVPRPRRPARRQEAQAADEMWRAVADAMPELIIVVNGAGLITEGNVAAAKTFGLTRQRLAGRPFPDLIDPFDRAKAVLLYRPVLRTVKGWELNLLTTSGPRLFSFQTWPVVRSGETMLTLVATEMFAVSLAPPETIEAPAPLPVPIAPPVQPLAPPSTLQALLDQLPVGLGISTVGRDPRMVYANDRFLQAIETPRTGLTGTRLRDVVRDRAAAQAIQAALDAKTSASLRGVRVQSSSLLHPRGKRLDIALRPLESLERKVASMLITVVDVTADDAWLARLGKLVGDRETDRAAPSRQLAELSLDYLTSIGPHADFAVVIESMAGGSGAPSVIATSPGWSLAPRHLLAGRTGALIHESAQLGRKGELQLREGRGTYHVAVRPFRIDWDGGEGVRHGVVAWRSPADRPPPPEEVAAIESFLPRMSLAADMLNARAEALRKASQLDALAGAASVVATTGDAAVGTRFVDRLAQALRSEGAAIGTVEGTRLVIGAGRGLHSGDRLQAPKHVLDAVRGAEPVARTVPADRRPGRRGGPGSGDVHELAVPLIVDRQVRGVIALTRRGPDPFDADEVRLVQTLSSVALLALALVRGTPQA